MATAAQQFCEEVKRFISQQASGTLVYLSQIGCDKKVQAIWQQVQASQPKAKMKKVLTDYNIQGWSANGEKKRTKKRKRAVQRVELAVQQADLALKRQCLEEERIKFDQEKAELDRDRQHFQESTQSVWQFQDGDEWKPYSPEHGARLTAARDRALSQVAFRRSHFTYYVDLAAMRQVNKRTGTQRGIRCLRVPGIRCAMPGLSQLCDKFAAVASANFRVSLTADSIAKGSLEEALYCRAEAQCHRMAQGARLNITQVDIIVNKLSAQRYENAKVSSAASGQLATEEYGFHGTAAPNVDKIVSEGFKVGGVDVPSLHGSAYGTGVYIAKHPELSLSFAGGMRSLFVVRFLAAHANLHREAWVVPNSTHVYPEFIVHIS